MVMMGLLCLAQLGWTQSVFPPGVVPWDFQYYGVGTLNIPCGHLFMDSYRDALPFPYQPTSLIFDARGDILWYHRSPERKVNFSMLPDGRMYWVQDEKYMIIDTHFALVDTIECANGIHTDLHELHVDHQGHYFLICGIDSTEDLSGIQTQTGAPGSTTGIVRYNTIQELDGNYGLVREWDPRPYFEPADAHARYFTNANFLDLMHTNSIDTDTNGQVIISNRHVSEVTCIDWASGQINWRLGGVHNQFSIQNDPGISAQHDARFQGNGQISVFDNGVLHQPHISRGIVFNVDEQNMEVDPAWAYTHPSLTSTAMGNFQRFPNGGGLISWGAGGGGLLHNFYIVNNDSTLQTTFRLSAQYLTYRVRCYDLPFTVERPTISCSSVPGGAMLTVDGNPSDVLWSTGETTSSIMVMDTGSYQVFVAKGIGRLASRPLRIVDVNNPCIPLGITPPIPVKPVELGIWDVLGRPVAVPESGQLYLRRYSDGSAEKFIFLD